MGNFATQESVERTKQEAFQHSDQQYEALSGNYDSLRQNVESLNDDLDKMREKLAGVKKSSEKMDELEKRISSFEGRSIEVVGLLSSVVALVLVSASTANSQRDSLSAYLIIVSIAAALMLFACLLHAFFQPQSNRSFWKYWLPFALLPGFVIVVAGVLAYANSIVKR
jgi:ABC-type transport system involved in cytochrome bd biosynthesis fused ATPase/permease subunit